MRVIGFLRVSTTDQEHGFDAQRTSIRLEAERRGWDVIWLENSGHSGKSLDRPAVREALAMLERGDAAALAISKLDRLTRSVYDFSGLLSTSVDGHGRPLAMIVTVGQRNDGAMLAEVLAQIHVPRGGKGRPRTRPDAVIADRACATGVIRTELRRRGLAITYRVGVTLCAILTWQRLLGDTP